MNEFAASNHALLRGKSRAWLKCVLDKYGIANSFEEYHGTHTKEPEPAGPALAIEQLR
jgi:hypothetical protein